MCSLPVCSFYISADLMDRLCCQCERFGEYGEEWRAAVYLLGRWMPVDPMVVEAIFQVGLYHRARPFKVSIQPRRTPALPMERGQEVSNPNNQPGLAQGPEGDMQMTLYDCAQ